MPTFRVLNVALTLIASTSFLQADVVIKLNTAAQAAYRPDRNVNTIVTIGDEELPEPYDHLTMASNPYADALAEASIADRTKPYSFSLGIFGTADPVPLGPSGCFTNELGCVGSDADPYAAIYVEMEIGPGGDAFQQRQVQLNLALDGFKDSNAFLEINGSISIAPLRYNQDPMNNGSAFPLDAYSGYYQPISDISFLEPKSIRMTAPRGGKSLLTIAIDIYGEVNNGEVRPGAGPQVLDAVHTFGVSIHTPQDMDVDAGPIPIFKDLGAPSVPEPNLSPIVASLLFSGVIVRYRLRKRPAKTLADLQFRESLHRRDDATVRGR